MPRLPHPLLARRRAPTAIVMLLLVAACGGAKDARSTEGEGAVPAGAAGAATTGTAGAAGAPACAQTGDWQACSVKERLERAGLAPQPEPDSVRRAGFSVGGTRYVLGKATLDVFLYPSTAARERETRALDSATAAPPGTARPGLHPPTLILSNNLAAVLQGAGETQAERVELALTAGLPPR